MYLQQLNQVTTLALASQETAVHLTAETLVQAEHIPLSIMAKRSCPLTQEQYAAYALILTEGTDYTISGTTITLTAAGMAKLSENNDDEHGTGEYEESDENEVYSVYYGTEKIFGLTEEDFAEFSQMLELNTDYTISGTNITLTDNGLAKIMAMDPSDEEDEADYYYQ